MTKIIIGTAGHIDHGKTTLIKSLCQIETDRLIEEKKRGITIELGFAYFDLENGERVGIIDVPGHERFIKNMLAGSSSIDIVLLVISAVDGIMPQTREHIDILSFLGVEKAIIVLTKCDLVEKDWIEMVKSEITEEMKDTFLEDAKIIESSLGDENSVKNIKNEIETLSKEIKQKKETGNPRLHVDRVFTMTGFGTVVTGTLMEGKLAMNEKLVLYPKMLETRVKRIQVHGEEKENAYPGQRVALNLANLKTTDIDRGDTLSKENALNPSFIIDVRLSLLKNTNRTLKNWTRLRLYHGSKEILCRLVLLDAETLEKSENAFAQLRLEEKHAFKYGDKFVIRFYSPQETIGGGVILDPKASKHKRFKDEVIEELALKNQNDDEDIILDQIYRNSEKLLEIDDIHNLTSVPLTELETKLKEYLDDNLLILIDNKYYLHIDYINDKNTEAIKIINDYYAKNKLKIGMPKEELRKRLFSGLRMKFFDEILKVFTANKTLEIKKSNIALFDYEINLTEKETKTKDKIIDKFQSLGFNPSNNKEIFREMNLSKIDIEIFDYLVEIGEIIRLTEAISISKAKYEEAEEIVKNHFKENDKLKLADFRDKTASSRKIALAILDKLDEKGITKRLDDYRILV